MSLSTTLALAVGAVGAEVSGAAVTELCFLQTK
jgi:hypothetical protein